MNMVASENDNECSVEPDNGEMSVLKEIGL